MLFLPTIRGILQRMDNPRATQWLKEIISNDSNRSAAAKTGIEHTTLRKRAAGEGLTPAEVIAVARAYGRPVVQSLVATGFLTDEEAFESNMISTLAQATDDQMADEIMRRFKAGQASKVLTD